MSTTEYRFSAKTHVGLRRRVNEDAVLALPEQDIWVVSDGMGGHEAGDYASNLIADMIAGIPRGLEAQARMQALRNAIAGAHAAILSETKARGGGVIGATVAALLLAKGHFVALWAGDSRIYRLRNGKIDMLTTDHSAVAAFVAAGTMSWDEAERHPQSNAITRAVGVGDAVELDKVGGDVVTGDRFLICSDGLTKYATFAMLEDALNQTAFEDLSEHLVSLALSGGGADNISVIVIDVL